MTVNRFLFRNMLVIQLLYHQTVVNCSWNEWQEWSTCSASCEGGTQKRFRVKNRELYGGLPCNDSSMESRVCKNETCKYVKDELVYGIVVDDTKHWSLNKISKCCCEISQNFKVKKYLHTMLLNIVFNNCKNHEYIFLKYFCNL